MNTNNHDVKKHGRQFTITIIALGLASISLLWGWNTFGVEILSLKPLQFRHVLALLVFLFTLIGISTVSWHFFRRRIE